MRVFGGCEVCVLFPGVVWLRAKCTERGKAQRETHGSTVNVRVQQADLSFVSYYTLMEGLYPEFRGDISA